MIRGVVKFLLNPLEAERVAVTKSDYMRIRSEMVNRELRDTIDDIHNNRSRLVPFIPTPLDPFYNQYREFSAKAFSAVNHWVAATPAWIGAYEDAIAGRAVPAGRLKPLPKMDEDEAIAFADKVVGKSHGSGMEMDMGTFQSGGGSEFLKTENLYNVFKGTFASLIREGAYHAFKGMDTEQRIAGWKQMLISIGFVSTIAGIAADHFPRVPIDKDPAAWIQWQFDNMTLGLSHVIPMGPTIYNIGKDMLDMKWPEFEVSPLEGTITAGLKGAVDIERIMFGNRRLKPEQRSIENISILIGLLFAMPGAGQAGETLQGIHDILHPPRAGRVTRPASGDDCSDPRMNALLRGGR